MQKHQGSVLFSAGDLIAHLECAHATTLALQDLETPLARAEDDDTLKLIQPEACLSGLSGYRAAECPPKPVSRSPRHRGSVGPSADERRR